MKKKVTFNDKVIIKKTYSKYIYDRGLLLHNLYRNIQNYYLIESQLAKIINYHSLHKIYTESDGNFEIKITNRRKRWDQDNSPNQLLKFLEKKDRKSLFMKYYDSIVIKKIKNNTTGAIEFPFYKFTIFIGNIKRGD